MSANEAKAPPQVVFVPGALPGTLRHVKPPRKAMIYRDVFESDGVTIRQYPEDARRPDDEQPTEE